MPPMNFAGPELKVQAEPRHVHTLFLRPHQPMKQILMCFLSAQINNILQVSTVCVYQAKALDTISWYFLCECVSGGGAGGGGGGIHK